MQCSHCGTELESNALVCPFCGQAVSDESRLQEQYGGKQLTKKEFLGLPAMQSCKSNINTCGIALYVIGAINIVLELATQALPIDGILLILLGLGIHLGKSRVCAILCTAFGGFNVVYMIVTTGRIAGWWILLAGIYALTYTFKYHSAWSKYKKDGTLPVEKNVEKK